MVVASISLTSASSYTIIDSSIYRVLQFSLHIRLIEFFIPLLLTSVMLNPSSSQQNFNKFLSVSVFQLDVQNPVNLIVGRKFNLHSKDIVFIPAAGIVKWNRTISLLLPQTDLFKSYNPIIQEGAKFESANQTE